MKPQALSLVVKSKMASAITADHFIVVEKFTLDSLREFRKDFYKLTEDPDLEIIPIFINSYGGNVESLLGMLDIISSSAKTVATIANGPAMSCGAVLLAAGHKNYRFAAPNARIMIHQMSAGTSGKMSDLSEDVKDIKELSQQLMQILDNLCGKAKGFFDKIIAKKKYSDVYLTPSQAKKYGLVDYISLPQLLEYK